MENWYLACHKTGKQNAFKAQMFLSRLDITVFIPQVCNYQPRADRPGRFKKQIEALFPGYMFICFDPEVIHTSKISTCPGVSHLVRFANTICQIHDFVIDEIMHQPICTHFPVIEGSKNNQRHKKNNSLTIEQREEIKKIVAGNNGLTRSALLYAFIESISLQKN